MSNKNNLTTKYVKNRIREISNDMCVSTEYKNAKAKLKFKCNEGHIYYKSWDHFQRGQRCTVCSKKANILRLKSNNNPNWNGGIYKYRIPPYNTFATQISFCEEVRRDPKNRDILQVRCTESNCRKWFTPDRRAVRRRIGVLKGQNRGESRLYCSNKCKSTCSIFGQKKYPKGFKNYNNQRPDQLDWAKTVKERDNYTCQRCGEIENLIAHHIEGIEQNPIMSVDVDIGITLCKECDKEVHSGMGCRPIDLTRKQLCKE